MYTIYNNGALLFSPGFDEYTLEAPTLTLEANKFGTLQFTIYPDHPQYSHIDKLTSTIEIFKDGVLYMQFRPVYSKRAFRNGVTYKCESILARLNDFQFRPFDYKTPDNYQGNTIAHFMQTVLDSYNGRLPVDSPRRVLLGNVTVTDPNNYVHYSSIDYLPHYEVLKTRLVDTHGGYFMERHTNGNTYIDYLREEDLPSATQPIRFGENMTDLFIETDSADTFSVLVPVGADVEYVDEYGNTQRERLTIADVNQGVDYLVNDTAVAIYGYRETSHRWPDVTVAANLKTKGEEYLAQNAVKFKQTVSVTAIDLHNADSSISSYMWMQLVPVQSAVHDLNETYILTKLTLPLGNPLSGSIQLGGTQLLLSDRINNVVSPATQTYVEGINQEIQQTITEEHTTLESMIATTESGIMSAVREDYVSKSEMGEYQQTVSTSIQQTQQAITVVAENAERYTDAATSGLQDYVDSVQTYMRYSVNGLELGQRGSGFTTNITNEKISFNQDNQEVAYIGNRKMYITEAQITKRLLFGTGNVNLFAWVFDENGLGLRWTGNEILRGRSRR